MRDVNDHAPIFNQKRYEGTIRENVQIGHSVLKVIATDADYSSENRNVFYRLGSGRSITLVWQLDKKRLHCAWIAIVGVASSCNACIDASLFDSRRIVDGNVGGAFNVRTVRGPGDQYIGEVFVRSTLDRETNSAYTLTISAFDRGKPQQSR